MTDQLRRVSRALISVSDKSGLVELARALAAHGIELVSTGGTRKALADAGLQVLDVSELTGFPEMMDGRVKTLHPSVHGGLLAIRNNNDHAAAMAAHGIRPIDLLVVNLYPFEATVAKGADFETCVENIDIGGPAMIRAAAKNHADVAVLVDASDYPRLLAELTAHDRATTLALRRKLAAKAYARTAVYDAAISNWFAQQLADPAPDYRAIGGHLAEPLRYGENPHQAAAFYRPSGGALGLSAATQLHGPELSYNNLLDWSAALGLLLEFDDPAAVVIKHTNPCGVATGQSAGEAARRAKACDPVSIYGGIVGLNRTVDLEVVKELSGILLEILFAPAYEPDALEEIRRTKKKCRVFQLPCARADYPARSREIRSVWGGVLVQEADLVDLDPAALTVASKRPPTEAELRGLRFGWRVAKHAKSNAIVLATADQVVGVGAGQMNRVDSARIAVMRARELGLETKGSVCASDAFFPFRDGLDVVAKAGATAVIHPGGSVRDAEIVAAANEHGMAMVVCGIRHFKH